MSDVLYEVKEGGIAWRDMAMKEGFREAVRRRDAPWSDYGEAK